MYQEEGSVSDSRFVYMVPHYILPLQIEEHRYHYPFAVVVAVGCPIGPSIFALGPVATSSATPCNLQNWAQGGITYEPRGSQADDLVACMDAQRRKSCFTPNSLTSSRSGRGKPPYFIETTL